MDAEIKIARIDKALFVSAVKFSIISIVAALGTMTTLVFLTTQDQNQFYEYIPYSLTITISVAFVVSLPVIFYILLQRRKLDIAYEKLEHMVRFDPLTGALSRRAFFEDIEETLMRPQEAGQSNAVAFLDLDYFKKVNDSFGHAVGDEVLRVLGDVFKDQFQRGEIVGRLGGEEFGVFLPECSLAHAEKRMQRLIDEFKKRAEVVSGEAVNCTLSVGVAASSTIRDLDTLLGKADEQLYRAKQEGRNCVAVEEAQCVVAERVAA